MGRSKSSKKNDGKRRNMPKPQTVRNFWAPRLVEMGKFYSVEEVSEGDYCFACGFPEGDTQKKTQRAHIRPINRGGSNDPSNIHLLCTICHKNSEHLFGEAYMEWFRTRSIIDRLLAFGVHYVGFNPAWLIKPPPRADMLRWLEDTRVCMPSSES